MGPGQALALDLLKAGFVFWCPTNRRLLSFCGGMLSLLVMWLAVLCSGRCVLLGFILSVCGALAHNIGQLLGPD